MKKSSPILGLVTAFLLGIYSSASARPPYLTQFNTNYGTSGTVLNTCGLCHINPEGGGARNPYGVAWENNGFNFAAIELLDSDDDSFTNITEINARTFPGNPNSHPAPADITAPTVTAFSIPAASSALIVSITSFTATDDVGVTGYMVTETSDAPAASVAGWSAAAPESYTFATAGAKTLFAWARDAAGNVSATGMSANVNVIPCIKGDLDGDGIVSLGDAVLALQALTGPKDPSSSPTLFICAEVNADNRIGLPEAIYALQKTAGIR